MLFSHYLVPRHFLLGDRLVYGKIWTKRRAWLFPSCFESFALQFLQHFCDTSVATVVLHAKPNSTALHFPQFLYVLLIVRVLWWTCASVGLAYNQWLLIATIGWEVNLWMLQLVHSIARVSMYKNHNMCIPWKGSQKEQNRQIKLLYCTVQSTQTLISVSLLDFISEFQNWVLIMSYEWKWK